jgi:hypothetical protein
MQQLKEVFSIDFSVKLTITCCSSMTSYSTLFPGRGITKGGRNSCLNMMSSSLVIYQFKEKKRKKKNLKCKR